MRGFRMRRILVPLARFGACLRGWASASGAADNSGNAALQYGVAFALCPPENEIQSATTDNVAMDPNLYEVSEPEP
jgi:hypothetical protein